MFLSTSPIILFSALYINIQEEDSLLQLNNTEMRDFKIDGIKKQESQNGQKSY